jgi:TRAP-type C4-dicarboxylate transport system permease small subunit
MRRVARSLAYFPEIVSGLTLLAITLILFAGVVWRYFFVDPLSWSDEIARALFVWLAFIGAALGVKRRLHSAVSALTDRLPVAWRMGVSVLGLVVVGVMSAVLLYTGAIETVANFQQVMPVTGLSRGWLYLSVPVSGLLMLVYLVPQFVAAVRGTPLPSGHDGHD